MNQEPTEGTDRSRGRRQHSEDAPPEQAEPTPGSDGDGAESGYTPPEELPAEDKRPKPPG